MSEDAGLAPTTAPVTPSLPSDLDQRVARGKSLIAQGLAEHNAYTDPVAIDVARGVGNALPHLASNVANLADEATGGAIGSVPDWNPFGETKTVTGGMAQGITEFALDMAITAGSFEALGAADAIKGLKYGSKILPLAEGAVADFTAFRAHNSRLSDMAWSLGENNPLLRNPITSYLHGDKDEGWFEGRVKNVLEGAGLGALTGILVSSFKALKGSRSALEAGGEQAAAKAMAEASPALEDELGRVKGQYSDLPGNNGFDVPPEAPIPGEAPALSDTGNTTGLRLDGMGKGVTDNLYAGLFNALKNGETKFAGIEDPILKKAKPLFDAGEIKTPEDLKNFVNGNQPVSTEVRGSGTEGPVDFHETDPGYESSSDPVAAKEAAPGNPAVSSQETYTPLPKQSDPEELARAGKVIADAVAKGDNFSKALADNGINLFHVDASNDLLKLSGSISKFVEEHVAPNLKDVESRQAVVEQATQAAQDLGMRPEAFVTRLSDIAGETGNLSQKVTEARIMVHTVVSDFSNIAKIAGDNKSLENQAKFLTAWQNVKNAMGFYRETQRAVGRGLGIFNANISAVDRIAQLEALQRNGGSTRVGWLIDEANRINALTPDADKTVALRRLMEQNKFWGVLNEFRINSMLGSGPGFGADAVSNAFKTLTMPLEKALASGFSLDMGGVREAMSAYRAFGNQLFDSFRTASAAFKLGDTILDNTIENGHQAFIKGSTFGLSGTGLGRAIDILGTVVRLPSRLRMTGDEFFKQLNYRAFMESKFVREAMENGVKDVDSYVSSKMFQSFDEIGRGINSDALDYARQATFSTPLVSGFSGRIMHLAAEFPAIRLLVPFIKTPLNIFFDTVGHTPLVGALLKDQRDALMGGLNSPAAREVLAKWSLGGALLATGVYLHHAGVLTGRGSMDHKTQEQMKLDGWQPYSVAYTNSQGKKEYVGFNRIEPWGSLLGLIADYSELGPSMQDFQVQKATTAMGAAVWRNIASKTYLKGISDFITAASNPDRGLESYLASFVGSFVPRSLSIFSGDPYVREARGVMDGIRAKIPGASEALPPRRNLLGEPIDVTKYSPALPADISPFAFSESVKDPVKVELASLGNGFKNPDPVQYGVDYRTFKSPKGQTAYDRMLELVGKTQIDGKNISQTLNGLINTKDYSKLVSSGDAGLPYRIKTVGQVLAKFHVASEEQMLKEFPQLRLQVQTGRIKKASDLFNAVQQQQQAGLSQN